MFLDCWLYNYYIGSRGGLLADSIVTMTQPVSSKHSSLPSTFSSGKITEWFTCFEICIKANERNEATQALKLPTLLEGEALASWLSYQKRNKETTNQQRKLTIGKTYSTVLCYFRQV